MLNKSTYASIRRIFHQTYELSIYFSEYCVYRYEENMYPQYYADISASQRILEQQ